MRCEMKKGLNNNSKCLSWSLRIVEFASREMEKVNICYLRSKDWLGSPRKWVSIAEKKRKPRTGSWSIPTVKKFPGYEENPTQETEREQLAKKKEAQENVVPGNQRKYVTEEEMLNSVELWRLVQYNDDGRMTTDGTVTVKASLEWSKRD